MKRFIAFVFVFVIVSLSPFYRVFSAEIMQDKFETVLGKVVSIISQEEKNIPGTDTKALHQTIKVELLEGWLKGEVVEINNDYLNLKEGEKFYVLHTIDWDSGQNYFSVQEKYRLPGIFVLLIVFIAITLYFGRSQGFRGLISLGGSVLLIIFALIPGILAGYPPIPLTIFVSSVIIVLGSYITHGFNKVTSAAVVGMMLTVVITGLFAYFSVHLTSLSGYESEEATYLVFNSRGSIDMLGLLFGSIMIGLLGVLYDAAISQAISVEELWKIAPHVSPYKIYERAIRIGREHIGALVDTLAIAYVGASLPLLLLFFQTSTEHPFITLNREIFATEIVRIIIGSIGLILAVPVTTLVAVRMLKSDHAAVENNVLEKEEHSLDHSTHLHKH